MDAQERERIKTAVDQLRHGAKRLVGMQQVCFRVADDLSTLLHESSAKVQGEDSGHGESSK